MRAYAYSKQYATGEHTFWSEPGTWVNQSALLGVKHCSPAAGSRPAWGTVACRRQECQTQVAQCSSSAAMAGICLAFLRIAAPNCCFILDLLGLLGSGVVHDGGLPAAGGTSNQASRRRCTQGCVSMCSACLKQATAAAGMTPRAVDASGTGETSSTPLPCGFRTQQDQRQADESRECHRQRVLGCRQPGGRPGHFCCPLTYCLRDNEVKYLRPACGFHESPVCWAS